MPKRLVVNIGDNFGRLTIVKEIERSECKKKRRRFLCKCSCGNKKVIKLDELIRGNTKSCGCLRKESSTTHGKYGHRLYQVWANMKSRCSNSNSYNYDYYGGRGIIVCEDWSKSFQSFLDDMEGSYQEGLELDRVNNDKGYSKNNCRWVTRQQNIMNTRVSKNSASKYKGVFKNRSTWRAQIRFNAKTKHLGTFPTQEEAALAYDKAALELFGEYANLNFKETTT